MGCVVALNYIVCCEQDLHALLQLSSLSGSQRSRELAERRQIHRLDQGVGILLRLWASSLILSRNFYGELEDPLCDKDLGLTARLRSGKQYPEIALTLTRAGSGMSTPFRVSVSMHRLITSSYC